MGPTVTFNGASPNGRLQGSVLACPSFSYTSDPAAPSSSIVGLLNGDAFTRSGSFNSSGILGGDIRFAVLDYSSKSAPNRFRYLTSDVTRDIKHQVITTFSFEREKPDGSIEIVKDTFRQLAGSNLMNQVSTDFGMWHIGESSVAR